MKSANYNEEDKHLQKTWDLLKTWTGIKPSPDFSARFWEKVVQKEREPVPHPFTSRLFPQWHLRWVPVLATLLVFLAGGLVFQQISYRNKMQKLLVMNQEYEIEMFKNLELMENLEIIQNLELLEQMEENQWLRS